MATGVVVLGAWPVTTRYGVNYRWSTKRISLFEKTVNFISRDVQMRRIAGEVAEGASTGEQKALVIFGWVVRHVRPTPLGLPIVDDHVLNILIRGYGAPDQRAEAMAVLASYNGMPANATPVRVPDVPGELQLTLVRVDGRIAVFDVSHELVFRNAAGQLADVDDMKDPRLVTSTAHGILVEGVPYERYQPGLQALGPAFSRMERQKLWPRIKFEVGRWVHLGGG